MLSLQSTRRTGLFGAGVLGLVLAACASDTPSPTDFTLQALVEPPELHLFAVCAVGVGADYEVVTTVLPAGTPTTTNFSVAAGACTNVASSAFAKMIVQVTQLPATNVVLDSIVKQSFIIPVKTPDAPQKITVGAVVTDTIDGDNGNIATFYNRALGPDLRVTKTADAGTVTAGSAIGFTITVTNAGPGVATGVTLSDPLPTGAGLSWSESPDVTACSITAGVLNCSFGDMAAGASASVHVTSPTTEASCGTYNNTATADATNDDAVTASASTTVDCPETWEDETAVGAGTRYPGTSNWFMYTAYTTSKVDLIAGQHYDAGDITMSRSGGNTTITITLHAGFRWAPVSDNLKIQPFTTAPTTYLAPGKFQYKWTVSGNTVSVTIPGTSAGFYGIHGDVQRLVP